MRKKIMMSEIIIVHLSVGESDGGGVPYGTDYLHQVTNTRQNTSKTAT